MVTDEERLKLSLVKCEDFASLHNQMILLIVLHMIWSLFSLNDLPGFFALIVPSVKTILLKYLKQGKCYYIHQYMWSVHSAQSFENELEHLTATTLAHYSRYRSWLKPTVLTDMLYGCNVWVLTYFYPYGLYQWAVLCVQLNRKIKSDYKTFKGTTAV